SSLTFFLKQGTVDGLGGVNLVTSRIRGWTKSINEKVFAVNKTSVPKHNERIPYLRKIAAKHYTTVISNPEKTEHGRCDVEVASGVLPDSRSLSFRQPD